jgi:hypothetical protein
MQRRDKQEGMHFRSPIVRRGGEISNKLLSWHSYARNDLKKYSYVTCRGEQSPSKFDTYSRQVKSTFGWKADLNTLTVRQVKSTFGTKRLTELMRSGGINHACLSLVLAYKWWKLVENRTSWLSEDDITYNMPGMMTCPWLVKTAVTMVRSCSSLFCHIMGLCCWFVCTMLLLHYVSYF